MGSIIPKATLEACPICAAPLTVSTSVFIGDARCLACREELWFIQTSVWLNDGGYLNEPERLRVFATNTTRRSRERTVAIIAEHYAFGCSSRILNVEGALDDWTWDEIDEFELAVKLEEEVDLSLLE